MMRRDRVVAQQQTRSGAVWRSAGPLLIVCLAGLGVTLPFLLKSYAMRGDDVLAHLFRLVALDQQVNLGSAYPLRFPGHAFGYGAAVFSYYPPLAFYLMEAAHLLGANYVLAYKVAFTVAALGAALSSYYLGARAFNRAAGVAASIAYVYNPYFLTNLWVRGAVTEAFTLAIAPLLFAAVLRVTAETGWRSYLETSLVVALMMLAHPLPILLFAPFLALYGVLALVLMERGRRWRAVMILVASVFMGCLLSLFYWLPVQLESAARRTVDLSVALGDYVQALKPAGQVIRVGLTTAFRSGETVLDYSLAMLLLVVIALLYFALTVQRRGKKEKIQFAFFAVSATLAYFAMTTWARPLWEMLTPFAYLQFPFRWFGPLALFTALIIGGSFDIAALNRSDRWYGIAVSVLLGFLVITSWMRAPGEPAILASAGIAKVTAGDLNESGLRAYEHDDAVHYATEGCWVWANRLVPSTSFLSDCPRYLDTVFEDVPVRSGLPPINAQVIPTAAGRNVLEATVNSPEPWHLSLHALWIPGWSATVDGQPAKTEPTDAIGVAGIALPAGEHRVRLTFGPTLLRRVVTWISLLALVGWLVIAWRRHWRLAAMVSAVLLLMVGLIGAAGVGST